MTIPTLSTSDKLFICSYNIGSNVDHRLALGIINEYTTFTSEYIDGFCWIPVNCDGYIYDDDDNHSWYWDLPDKDVVYVKVGMRVSADGYLHAWLLNTQKVSELIIWNTNYNTQHYARYDKTVLHWCIEKMYQAIFGNTTSFIPANIKFQNYVTGSTRLYLFGSYSNSLINPVIYTIDHPTNVKKSSVTWYPNNSDIYLGDYLYSKSLGNLSHECDRTTIGSTLYDTSISAAFLDDGGSFTDYTTAFNNNFINDTSLIPFPDALNDSFYFGNSYRFYELKLNIGTAGSGVGDLITWEYYGNSGWTQFFPTDPTNEFTSSGTNTIVSNMNEDDMNDWETTTVNGSNLYWIRARSNYVSGTNYYTTQPILTQGWVRIPDYWVNFSSNFNKESGNEPSFWKEVKEVPYSESIISICHPSIPAVPLFKNWVKCHIPTQFSGLGTGNNSGRNYTMAEYGTITPCDSQGYTFCTTASEKWMRMNCEPNRAWTFVAAHCSFPAYNNQTDCEANGGTWYPDEYICDSSFTYDTFVNYTVNEWNSVTPNEINHSQGQARFDGYLIGQEFLCTSYKTTTINIFNEFLGGDLDELRHHNFTITDTGSITDKLYTIFTKHVAIGLLTDAAPTIDDADWIITWGAQNYFSNWQTPDGLSARTPTSTNTPYIRPLTYRDEFKVVSGEPLLGGFLYEPVTSNAFLSRDPGTEIKITYPVCNKSDFDYLYGLIISNAFLSRDPGTETKILFPVSNQSDFDFLNELLTSNGFLSRNPGTETKIEYSVCDKADFSFLYKLIKHEFFNRYHLKTTGDDTKDGLSWDDAWEHWTHSMQNTPDEGTLLVEEGTYNDAETQVEPDNSIIIYLTKNYIDDVSTVTVTI